MFEIGTSSSSANYIVILTLYANEVDLIKLSDDHIVKFLISSSSSVSYSCSDTICKLGWPDLALSWSYCWIPK